MKKKKIIKVEKKIKQEIVPIWDRTKDLLDKNLE